MDAREVLEILGRGEDSRHQFKEDVTHAKSVGAELAAFANAAGGLLLIGASDDGKVLGLTSGDVRRVNSLVANAATFNVRPAISLSSENVVVSGRLIVAIRVPPCADQPYFDSDGVIWQRVGPDKRKVHSREELQRMFQQSGLVQPDAVTIRDTGMEEIDVPELGKAMRGLRQTAPRTRAAAWIQLCRMGLVKGERLTLAGLLLFAKRPQRFKPQFCLRAVYFAGDSIASESYLDSENYEGRISQLFEGAFLFLRRNLRKVQAPGRSVNSVGVLEIPEAVLEELLCNAFLHRDYLIDAPIRLFVFDDRIEIVSPGLLGGGLTVENIREGASFIRNPLLTSFAIKGPLPYKGLGSGIVRVLQKFKDVEFVNHTAAFLFRAIVRRPVLGKRQCEDVVAVDVGNDVESVVGNSGGAEVIRGGIMKLIANNPRVSARLIASSLRLNPRRIQRHLRKLCEEGVLIHEGPDKGGSWRIIGS